MSDVSKIKSAYLDYAVKTWKSIAGNAADEKKRVSEEDMANNLAPEVSMLSNALAMENANVFFLSLQDSDQKRAVERLSRNLQDVLERSDQKNLLKFFLFRLRLIASAVQCNFYGRSSLIKLFDDICARLLANSDKIAAYLEDLALPAEARLSVHTGFKLMIESVFLLHQPERSTANLKILLLSDLIISKNQHASFFKSLVGSKWFQYVHSNGYTEDPMVVFHLITATIATGNCFPINRGEYILAITKLMIKSAAARPMEWWSSGCPHENRLKNVKNQLLEFFLSEAAAECLLNIPDEDLRKVLRCACDGIVTKDALVVSALAASDFAFKFEKTNSSDSSSSYSAESCAAYADIMIKHILANLFDAHHSNKKKVWSAIEEVNTVVQSRGSPQIKLMFQVINDGSREVLHCHFYSHSQILMPIIHFVENNCRKSDSI